MSERFKVYKEKVKQVVLESLAKGLYTFDEILPNCEGAHPEIVSEVLQEISLSTENHELSRHRFRTLVSEFFHKLPAPNPELSQWWFNIDTVEVICTKISQSCVATERNAICLGAPSIAYGLSLKGFDVLVLDSDEDLLQSVKNLSLAENKLSVKFYDARNKNILSVVGDRRFNNGFTDPPWYPSSFADFISEISLTLENHSNVFCSILPRLTRVSAEDDRTNLIAAMSNAGYKINSVERGILRYIVPKFEKEAYEGFEGFGGIGWRSGDLIQTQIDDINNLDLNPFDILRTKLNIQSKFKTYSREPNKFRVFCCSNFSAKEESVNDDQPLITDLESFSKAVGAKSKKFGIPHIWSSDNTGLIVLNESIFELSVKILEHWKEGKTFKETLDELNIREEAQEIIDILNDKLGLWERFESIDNVKIKSRTFKNLRKSIVKREYRWETDTYREPFARDRDRLVWSNSLRKLANKTQVFPANEDGNLRQRLAHSIEVVQLASTIGRALNLNIDLIEAGGFGHDIGHTPFGHAGEHAIHSVFATIHKNLFFNHYEHGVDIVRFLEGPYQFHPGHPGLNLTIGTIDCIYKHIYWIKENPKAKPEEIKPPSSLEGMYRLSKHSDILDSKPCHPEGQAVRLADKISYLVSDLEDGIRLGLIDFKDFLKCRLFHRAPIDFAPRGNESISSVFIRERRNILKVLMEDAIEASTLRWCRYNKKLEKYDSSFIIDQSTDISKDVYQIWKELQSNLIHNSQSVILANINAAKIVSELLLTFAIMPELIDYQFREGHEILKKSDEGIKYFAYYRDSVYNKELLKKGIQKIIIPNKLIEFLPLEKTIGKSRINEEGKVEIDIDSLILSKDYVASLSDSQAKHLHNKIVARSL